MVQTNVAADVPMNFTLEVIYTSRLINHQVFLSLSFDVTLQNWPMLEPWCPSFDWVTWTAFIRVTGVAIGNWLCFDHGLGWPDMHWVQSTDCGICCLLADCAVCAHISQTLLWNNLSYRDRPKVWNLGSRSDMSTGVKWDFIAFIQMEPDMVHEILIQLTPCL